jgi:hypothetical protein
VSTSPNAHQQEPALADLDDDVIAYLRLLCSDNEPLRELLAESWRLGFSRAVRSSNPWSAAAATNPFWE